MGGHIERPGSTVSVSAKDVRDGRGSEKEDSLATEEPMEIRVGEWDGVDWRLHPLSVTMRTPGNDFELAAGFLFSEGIVKDGNGIQRISYCTTPGEAQGYNIVNVYLTPGVSFDWGRLSRHVYTTSSCGVCGKGSIDLVRASCPQKPVGRFRLPHTYFLKLAGALSREQSLFSRTGGIHASALFDTDGRLVLLREDVGRHNAMDKMIGALLLNGGIPASDKIVLVSGRASFELVQKALMAGIPALIAVGAPTSLAVDLATEYGMSLVGFLREERFNIYAGGERVILKDSTPVPT